jgi:superoxide dismutase
LKEEKMAYTAKDYGKLMGITGFSETLLKNHFTLYQGYVTNTNKLLDTLAAMAKDLGKNDLATYTQIMRKPDRFWQNVLTFRIVEDTPRAGRLGQGGIAGCIGHHPAALW